jgi:tetratricopeptide (TPR) repeat protein
MIETDILDEDGEPLDIQEDWDRNWSVVDSGPLTTEELRYAVDFPGELDVTANAATTPSEKWLAYLFYPNRFSTASIESALHIYRKGRNIPATSSRGLKASDHPLQERLTTAITSKILLRRLPNEQPDYERYQQDIQAQWQVFYSLLSHLHNRRQEAVGFAFDPVEGLAWSVGADYVAPIRACSDLEKRSLNVQYLLDPEVENDPLYLAIYPEKLEAEDDMPYESVFFTQLMAAARELRRCLSSSARAKLAEGAALDALVPFDEAHPGRATAMYEKAGFEAEVSDEDFDALAASVERLGGIGSLKDDVFLGVLEWLDVEGDISGRDGRLFLYPYGEKVTVEVARETLEHAQAVILDILAVVVFMTGAFEPADLDDDFNAATVYDAAVSRLKKIGLLLWLVGHTRQQLQKSGGAEFTHEITLLDDVCIGDWRAIEHRERVLDMAAAITVSSKVWVHGLKPEEGNWDAATANILKFLLQHSELDLAQDFVKFTTDASAWSVYLKGRLHLATGDYAQAALCFNAAAEGLSSHGPGSSAVGLLPPDEMDYLGSGYAKYFQHIAALFEHLKMYSYVADFANLALQHTEALPDFAKSMADLDRRKSAQNSPVPERIAATQEEMRLLRLKDDRNEILNRWFAALRETGRWAEAFDVLQQVEDPPMRRSGVRRLVEGAVKKGDVPALMELDFKGEMGTEADRVLEEMARKELASSSPSATTGGTPAYQILYAFRTQRADFRGAAEILYERLRRITNSELVYEDDPEDETLVHLYVLLINTLACCGEEEAWLLASTTTSTSGAGMEQQQQTPVMQRSGMLQGGKKRRLVTLADLRREYTALLDQRSEVACGRFAFVGGGAAANARGIGGGEAMDVL